MDTSILNALFFSIGGASLLILGGEILVRGASRLALLMKIPPLIIGLTIVAACTSAPELAVSLTGCLKENNADIALGNAIGSNICNILLILAMTAIINPVKISIKMVKQQLPFLVAVSGLFWLLIYSFRQESEIFFPRWCGFLFLGLLVIYTIWTIFEAKHSDNKAMAEAIEKKKISSESSATAVNRVNSVQENESQVQNEVAPAAQTEVPKHSFCSLLAAIALSLLMIGIGLGMLLYGSDFFIKGAITFAKHFGVSELVISLTILAIGTSLPELVVSGVAAFQKKSDIAIGNVVGSNIFNLLCILGVSAAVLPKGLRVSEIAFTQDIPIMIGTALIGSILCITGKVLSRLEGIVLLLLYVGYIVLLINR